MIEKERKDTELIKLYILSALYNIYNCKFPSPQGQSLFLNIIQSAIIFFCHYIRFKVKWGKIL